MNSCNPINLLTVDLEDYFQVHAFSNAIRYEDWDKYESRIERNTYRLLEILNGSFSNPHSAFRTVDLDSPCPSALSPQTSQHATFFILGWIAERYPDLVRGIKDQGHEIACHGYAHRLIYNQSEKEFREDIRKAKAILEDITGSEIIGYRAPSYSITNKSQWAFEVLMEEGFQYDSSVFPIHHDFYGFPAAPRFPFIIALNGNSNFEFQMSNFEFEITPSSELRASNLNMHHSTTLHSAFRIPHSSTQSSVLDAHNLVQQHCSTAAPQHSVSPNGSLIEIPLSTVRFGGINFPISGGGYFRLVPYSLVKKGLKQINEGEGKPFIFYLHPWEIDPDQPRLNSVSFRSRFRHYINLDKTEERFKKLLADFRFSSIFDVLGSNTGAQKRFLRQTSSDSNPK